MGGDRQRHRGTDRVAASGEPDRLAVLRIRTPRRPRRRRAGLGASGGRRGLARRCGGGLDRDVDLAPQRTGLDADLPAVPRRTAAGSPLAAGALDQRRRDGAGDRRLVADVRSRRGLRERPQPVRGRRLPTQALLAVGLVLFLGAFFASAVSLALRLRRARGIERQQLKWFAFAAAVAVVVLSVDLALWYITPLAGVASALVLMALPVAAGVGDPALPPLRHRSRRQPHARVRGADGAARRRLRGDGAAARDRARAAARPGPRRRATLVAAVGVPPAARARCRRRWTAASTAPATTRCAASPPSWRTCVRAAPRPRRSSGAPRRARRPAGSSCASSCPRAGGYVDARGAPGADAPRTGAARSPIERAGQPLARRPAPPGGDAAPDCCASVVEAGGLAIEIARLRVELRRQLAEVEDSRARIVAAGDDERRRIERDLHDGAQQRLVSIGLALRHAQHELGGAARARERRSTTRWPRSPRRSTSCASSPTACRPAQLDDGLAPALRELAAPRAAAGRARRDATSASAPASRPPPTSSPARA